MVCRFKYIQARCADRSMQWPKTFDLKVLKGDFLFCAMTKITSQDIEISVIFPQEKFP